VSDLPDGWIAHDGGECPVALDSKVCIMLDGDSLGDDGINEPFNASEVPWTYPDWPLRIIAYKPEPSQ